MLSEEIVDFLYLRGGFTRGLADAAADALRVLSLAMPAYGMTELFSRVCYSCGRVRFPMLSSLGGIAVTLLLNASFLFCDTLSVKTISLASVLGQTVAGALLLFLCAKSFLKKNGFRVRKTMLLLPAWVLSGVSMWLCRDFLRQNLHFLKTFQNFLIITIVFTVGFVVYLIWLVWVGMIPIKQNS